MYSVGYYVLGMIVYTLIFFTEENKYSDDLPKSLDDPPLSFFILFLWIYCGFFSGLIIIVLNFKLKKRILKGISLTTYVMFFLVFSLYGYALYLWPPL